jgi:alanine dehydrogenase
MSKHTPGPWKLNDNTQYWKNNIFSITASKRGVHSVAVANMPARATIPVSEAWANARLMVAAPDLLEALQLADAMLSGANMDAKIVEKKVRSAIAKATGEQS